MFPAYTDKQDGSTVHAGQITAIEPAPHPTDAQRTRLRFNDGSESVCYGKWINDNAPAAGQFFVMFERGSSAQLFNGVDFMKRFELQGVA